MTFPIKLNRPLAFLDLETTGLSTRDDRIIEIAILRISPEGDVIEKSRRFNPGIPINPDATTVHGITDEDVSKEEPFYARSKALLEILDPCDLAGFNIRRFDLPMLIAEFRRAQIEFDYKSRKVIDVQNIFHKEEPRDLSAAARFYLECNHEEAHSALGDVRITADVLAAQIQHYPNLPRNIEALNQYCDEFFPIRTALNEWFEERDGGYVLRKGKHRNKTLSEVALTAPDYLQWMLTLEDMDKEVITIIQKSLA